MQRDRHIYVELFAGDNVDVAHPGSLDIEMMAIYIRAAEPNACELLFPDGTTRIELRERVWLQDVERNYFGHMVLPEGKEFDASRFKIVQTHTESRNGTLKAVECIKNNES